MNVDSPHRLLAGLDHRAALQGTEFRCNHLKGQVIKIGNRSMENWVNFMHFFEMKYLRMNGVLNMINSMKQNPSIESLASHKEAMWRCKAKLNHCEIWENTHCKIIAEAYPMWNGNGSRSHNSLKLPYVVECLATVGSDQKYLLLERIPNRLSEVQMINEPQSLKVLYAVFNAMANLQPLFGYFTLTQSCVCFNQSGQVKIWVHPNLSLVRPLKIYAPQKNITNKIIGQTLSLVENKCFNPMLFYGLKKKIEEVQDFSFDSAANFIRGLAEKLFVDLRELKDQSFQYSQHPTQLNGFSNKNSISSSLVRATSGDDENDFSKKGQFELYTNDKVSAPKKLEQWQHKRNKSSFDAPKIFKKSCQFGKVSPNNLHQQVGSALRGNYLSSCPDYIPQSPRNIDRKCVNTPSNSSFHGSSSGQKTKIQKSFSKSKMTKVEDKNQQIVKKPLTIQVQESQVNDSFSKGLTILAESKKAMEKDFQTFGNLEQNSNSNPSRNTYGDLDIAEMDAKIQKKLNTKDGKREIRRPSLETSTLNMEKLKERVDSVTIPCKEKQNHNPSGFWEENKKAKQSYQENSSAIDHKFLKYVAKTGEFSSTGCKVYPAPKKSATIYKPLIIKENGGLRQERNTINSLAMNFRANLDDKPYQTRR